MADNLRCEITKLRALEAALVLIDSYKLTNTLNLTDEINKVHSLIIDCCTAALPNDALSLKANRFFTSTVEILKNEVKHRKTLYAMDIAEIEDYLRNDTTISNYIDQLLQDKRLFKGIFRDINKDLDIFKLYEETREVLMTLRSRDLFDFE